MRMRVQYPLSKFYHPDGVTHGIEREVAVPQVHNQFSYVSAVEAADTLDMLNKRSLSSA